MNTLPGNGIRCPHCQVRWSGLSTAHCPTCHRTFTAPSGFDRHRRGGECVNPAQIGMYPYTRQGYVAWGGQPKNHDAHSRLTGRTQSDA